MIYDPDYLARLKWQCRRGMLELDFFFEKFVNNGLKHLDKREMKVFEALLEEPDPVLLSWFMGHQLPEDKETQAMVELISGGTYDKDV